MRTEKRDHSVSIAKAFAIMLMVLAHADFSKIGGEWINMFHMPLFFFFAGYCFKERYLSDFRQFVRKRLSGLYWPYVKWCFLFLLLHNIFFHLNIYNGEYGFRGNVSELYSVSDFLKRSFDIVTRMSGHEQLLGGFWFIKSLFVASFLGYFTIRYVKNYAVVGGVILLILNLVFSFLNLHVPFWGIGVREFMAALFFISGYYYKKKGYSLHEKWCAIPAGIILASLGTAYWQGAMATKFHYSQIIPYVVSAIAGTLMVFSLSVIINRDDNFLKKILISVGDNTLAILTWHFLCFKIVSLLIIYCEGLPIERLAEFPVIHFYSRQGWYLLYWLVGVTVPLLITRISFSKYQQKLSIMLDKYTTRNTSIELLRLWFMVMILTIHAYGHGSGLNRDFIYSLGEDWNTAYHLGLFSLGQCGVTGFIFISGYYGITLRWNKLLKMIAMLLFYIIVIGWIGGWSPLEIIRQAIHPWDAWWFVSSYIVICFFSPLINKGIEQLTEKQFRTIILFLLFYVYVGKFLSLARFHDTISLLTVFLTARYAKLYFTPPHMLSKYHKYILATTIISGILLFAVPILLSMTGWTKLNNWFISNSNILLLIFTASLVMTLDRKRTTNRYVNFLASSTLAIYLITDNPVIRMPLDTWLLSEMLNNVKGFAYILLIAFICLLIDKARGIIFEVLHHNKSIT